MEKHSTVSIPFQKRWPLMFLVLFSLSTSIVFFIRASSDSSSCNTHNCQANTDNTNQIQVGSFANPLNFMKSKLILLEARKRFDKTSLLYDQAREKFLSLRKGTKNDITTILEEELHNARSAFEQARFNLVTALSNVEAKKRFEFLEAVSGTMDAHLRYFKQGYELLNQMEPYISQVLTYAQQSRERSNYEQAALNERMQEYKRQIDRESKWS